MCFLPFRVLRAWSLASTSSCFALSLLRTDFLTGVRISFLISSFLSGSLNNARILSVMLCVTPENLLISESITFRAVFLVCGERSAREER